tara:strand:- start:44 stop:733 length:690 start_codon:yes stop_codon:yes gene_type:complete
MSFQKVVLGVIVVLILYVLYLYYFGDSSKKVLVGMHDAQNEVIVSGGSMPPGASSDYTFSIWVFVANWNYNIGKKKPIFIRGNGQADDDCPRMEFDSNLNNIDVTVSVFNSQPKTCTLENVPLQRWTNIIMTINNRALDLYLDGKLIRTCYLDNVPKIIPGANLALTPSGGFKGNTAKFQYLSRAINPREAYTIYKEGYGESGLFSLVSKYKLKFAFVKENKELNSFTL